ncbi:MAG: FliM/FliN family flagellar motor C-terminal domain-containing protein [Pseudomonadota bacterium]|nr:FliM/FliN family flagellar motor C-terminal domain-containing protein [Pseudomonadota bacterium]
MAFARHVMFDDSPQSVLKRMAAARAPVAAARPAMFPSRAVELALARAAEQELGLDLSVTGVAECSPELSEIEAEAGEHALLALLEGAEGASGILVLSAPVLGAVVAQRMTGRVPAQATPPRAPTRIDAEIARGLIDRTLAVLGASLDGQAALRWAVGFRYRGSLPDKRLIRFSLPEGRFHGFRLTLRLAGGAAEGTVFLALPEIPAPAVAEPAGASPEARAWSSALQDGVLGAEVTLDAVFARLRLPLSRVMALKVGEVLALPRASVDHVRLEDAGGALIGEGKLGQLRGDRALRLPAVTGATEKGATGGKPDAPELSLERPAAGTAAPG